MAMKKIGKHLYKDFQLSVGYGCGNMEPRGTDGCIKWSTPWKPSGK